MSDTRKPSITVTLVICCTLAFLSVLGAFVYLESTGKGTAGYVAFLAFAIGSIPAIANWKNNREVKNDTLETKAIVNEIKEQTNGPLTLKFKEQTKQIDDLKHIVETYRDEMRKIHIPEQRSE